MVPYADSLYFTVLIYPATIAIALGLAGRLTWRWVLIINVAMLGVQYSVGSEVGPGDGGTWPKVWVLTVFAAYEWAVARVLLRLTTSTSRRLFFRAAVGLALAPLMIAKFAPMDAAGTAVGFLGISYVTFRSLDVIICIHDRLISSLSPAQYLAYVLFFPTISAGPIDRYNRFALDWNRRRTRAEFLHDLDGGVRRFFRGLLYKFILATVVKTYWLDPVSTATGVLNVVSYMYAYALYLFFDFAGYSAFAIGLGYLFGVHTPENFNQPFLAGNIVDFWNRWHMSLSTWFRDHVYMRFVMAATRGRWFASKMAMSCLGFYLSFGLMGIWHGLAPRYFVYGLYHATLLSGYTMFVERRKFKTMPQDHQPSKLGIFVTFHLVCFGLLIFSGRLG